MLVDFLIHVQQMLSSSALFINGHLHYVAAIQTPATGTAHWEGGCRILLLILLCKRYSYCHWIPVQITCLAEANR